MTPIEYAIDQHVNIRLCPEHGCRKAYWYIKQRMFSGIGVGRFTGEQATELRRDIKCDCWYWTDNGWHWNTPKQYATPEEAERDYKTRQLELACESIFGGVGACSPEIYENLLVRVATMCGRSVGEKFIDDKFREDVKNAIRKLPCPLD